MSTFNIRLFNPSLSSNIPTLDTPQRGAAYLPFVDKGEVQYLLEVIPNGDNKLPTHSYLVLNRMVDEILRKHGADIILDRELVYDDSYNVQPAPHNRGARILESGEKKLIVFSTRFFPTIDGNEKSVGSWWSGLKFHEVTETV